MKLPAALLSGMAVAIALGGGAFAQDDPPPPPGAPPGGERPQRGRGPGGGTGERPRFVPPIITALDLDGDGTLSAEEIAKAAESLKKLDKNGDGKLTPEELRPPRPGGPRQGRPGGGERPDGGARRPSPEGGAGDGEAPRRRRSALEE